MSAPAAKQRTSAPPNRAAPPKPQLIPAGKPSAVKASAPAGSKMGAAAGAAAKAAKASPVAAAVATAGGAAKSQPSKVAPSKDDDDLDDIFQKKPATAPSAPSGDVDEDDDVSVDGSSDSDADSDPDASAARKGTKRKAEADVPPEEDQDASTATNQATLRRIKAKLEKEGIQRPPPDDLGFTRAAVAKGVPRTSEGYRIYQLDDLRLGRGKDTPLCPIDCECCF